METNIQKNVYFPPTTPIVGKNEIKKDVNDNYRNYCTVWQMLNVNEKDEKTKEKNT